MATEQPYLPGMEPAASSGMPKSAVMVIREGAVSGEVFPDMASLKGADLEAGTYEVWAYRGTITTKVEPQKVRMTYQSAVTRPRKGGKERKPRRKEKAGGKTA